MHVPRPARRFALALAAPLMLAGALTSPAPAAGVSAAVCHWNGRQPPGTSNRLAGVAVLSPCNVWAVGFDGTGISMPVHTLIEHWNGSAWRVIRSPSPGSISSFLFGVSAISARDIWAVGDFNSGSGNETLTEHWNGKAWSVVPGASLGGSGNELDGIHATSARDAWAVGHFSDGLQDRTLIEHWNGARWTQVPSPNPGGPADGDFLSGVAATSRTSAWAVGGMSSTTTSQALILHWNGIRWSRVASHSPADSSLSAVGALSAASIWAVGSSSLSTTSRTLILHWNGHAWAQVPSPSPTPRKGNDLFGVTVTAASDAWAVGRNGQPSKALVLHWNGRRWARVPTPSLGTTGSTLEAVAAASARDVWAVGEFSDGRPLALAIRCC